MITLALLFLAALAAVYATLGEAGYDLHLARQAKKHCEQAQAATLQMCRRD